MILSNRLDAIKRVLAAFERSDWTEIDVRSGDVRVHLTTRRPTGAPLAAPEPPSVGDAQTTTSAAADSSDTTSFETAAGDVPDSAAPPPDNAHIVVSPSPGIFWRSPEPGAPPFAEVGDIIHESTTVCIVEVMKLMNHIKAAVGGEVVAVYVENGVAVRKGEPLFAIAPSGSSC